MQAVLRAGMPAVSLSPSVADAFASEELCTALIEVLGSFDIAPGLEELTTAVPDTWTTAAPLTNRSDMPTDLSMSINHLHMGILSKTAYC